MLKYYVEKANTDDLKEKLKNDYPEIYKSMQKENYTIEYPTYGHIQEIRDKDKVVGIMVLQKFKEISLKYALSEFYIIPKYRNENIILQSFIELITAANLEIYIRKPSKSLVKNLIDCSLAIPIGNSTVVSIIPFVCDTGEIFQNIRLKNYLVDIGDKYGEFIHVSNYYNLKYAGVIISRYPKFKAKKHPEIMLTTPQRNDLNFNMRRKLKKLSVADLKNIAMDIRLYDEVESVLKKKVENSLNRYLTIDTFIGTSSKLDDFIVRYLEENNLTKEDGFKIREKIAVALKNREIENINIMQRFEYLVNPEITDPLMIGLSLPCPYCRNPIDYIQTSCINCGHDLKNERLFKSVDKIASRLLSDSDIKNLGDDDLQVNAVFTTKMIERIEKREYDDEEVFKAQSLYSCYLIIKALQNSLDIPKGIDLSVKIKEGGGVIYGINNGYLELLSKEKYRYILENEWGLEDIKSELESFGFKTSNNDVSELIDEIFEEDLYKIFIEKRFYPTQKGLELLECEMLRFYDENVDKNYLFYEFKTLWDENIEKLSPSEIHQKLIGECEKI